MQRFAMEASSNGTPVGGGQLRQQDGAADGGRLWHGCTGSFVKSILWEALGIWWPTELSQIEEKG